jgi:polyisoprenoid-binding protein YceI
LILYSIFCLICGTFLQKESLINFRGKVSFTSNAPLEIIKAESNQLQGVYDIKENKFAFSLKIKTFDGFNSSLQKEHFHENYLESEKYPNLTYVGKILDIIDWNKNGNHSIRSKGIFTIHGVQKEEVVKNKVSINNGIINIVSELEIKLNDYDIKIPKIVNKKIAEVIVIKVNLKNSNS